MQNETKAVIYSRLSSNKQGEEPIEGQLRECKAYAETHGFTVISEYVDRAMVRLKQGDRGLFSIFAKVL